MLDLLRRKAQSPYIQATIVIIILVFIFWLPKMGGNNRPNVVATVNDHPIGLRDYQQRYDRMVSELRDQLGGVIPKGLLETMNIKEQVINQLIEETLLIMTANEIGLATSAAEVARTIHQMEPFKKNGTFTKERYKKLLAQSRIAPKDFEAGIATDILKQKVLTVLGRFAFVSEQEIAQRLHWEYDQVKGAYLLFDPASFRNKVQVEEEALKEFFADHQEEYRTPVMVRLDYLAFTAQDEGGKEEIPEEAISRFYQENIERFHTPEERRARHILLRLPPDVSDEVKAEKRKKLLEIKARLDKGEDFAKLAQRFSEDTATAASGGDLGFFDRSRMTPPFAEAAFSLKKGEVSDIVETVYGFHLIKVEEIRPERTVPLQDAREEIINELRRARGMDIAFKRANEAYEKIITLGSMEKGAAAVGAEIRTTPLFTPNEAPAGLEPFATVLPKVFSLKQGELSSILEGNGGYLIVMVKERKEPEIPPLEQVRSRVTRDFVEFSSRKLAREAAEKALKNSGPQGLSVEFGGTAGETPFFARAEIKASQLPPKVAAKLFEMDDQPALAEAGQGVVYLLRVAERRPAADQAFSSAQREEVRAEILKLKQAAIVDGWIRFLKNRAEISVNTQAL